MPCRRLPPMRSASRQPHRHSAWPRVCVLEELRSERSDSAHLEAANPTRDSRPLCFVRTAPPSQRLASRSSEGIPMLHVDLETDASALPCAAEDPELFFAESPTDVELAKALCADC